MQRADVSSVSPSTEQFSWTIVFQFTVCFSQSSHAIIVRLFFRIFSGNKWLQPTICSEMLIVLAVLRRLLFWDSWPVLEVSLAQNYLLLRPHIYLIYFWRTRQPSNINLCFWEWPTDSGDVSIYSNKLTAVKLCMLIHLLWFDCLYSICR